MPLDLGLARIVKLLKVLGNPDRTGGFKAIHIAGTNGKGSICTYLSHILTANKISNGRFTSPHFFTRSDSIQINNVPIDPALFHTYESRVIDTDRQYGIGCTEFELLTCVAFQVFKEQKVDVAIFEVGVGGRLDATNVFVPQTLLCTGIAKIGLDHQKLLGNTIEEIAMQKLGILKEGVPCVIDGTNVPSVLELARNQAKQLHCPIYEATQKSLFTFGKVTDFHTPLNGGYQLSNLSVALKIIDVAKQTFPQINRQDIQQGLTNTKWPGRLDRFDLRVSKTQKLPVLLDGAHNPQAVKELVKYLDSSYRLKGDNVIYVMAIKNDKNLQEVFKLLFQPGDTVIFTQFKEGIDGMPWVHPSDVALLAEEAKGSAAKVRTQPVLEDALLEAYKEHEESGRNVVICGSLYLVSDVLRVHNRNA